jgi:hypothetical protein
MFSIRHRGIAILRMCSLYSRKRGADCGRTLLCPMLKKAFSDKLDCESPEVMQQFL